MTKRLLSLYAVWKCNHVWLLLAIMCFLDSTWMKQELFQPWTAHNPSPSACSDSLPADTERALRFLSFHTVSLSRFFPPSLLGFPRLSQEDLNSSVLAYMTETLGYALSETIHTLTTNRPSAIMASYHLLLNKLNRNQKGAKASKVHTSLTHTHWNKHNFSDTSVKNHTWFAWRLSDWFGRSWKPMTGVFPVRIHGERRITLNPRLSNR